MNFTDVQLAGPRLNFEYGYDIDPWAKPVLIVAPSWDISEAEIEQVGFLAACTAGVAKMILVSSSEVLAGRQKTEAFPEFEPWPTTAAGRGYMVAERVARRYAHCYVVRVSGLFGDNSGGPPWRYKMGENVYVPNTPTTDVSEFALLSGIRMGVVQGKRLFHVASRETYWKRAMDKATPEREKHLYSYKAERARDVNGRQYQKYMNLSVTPSRAKVSQRPPLRGSVLAGLRMYDLDYQIKEYIGG